jgi:hypothetical protein
MSSDDEEGLSRRRGALESEKGRSKYSGLEGFPWEKGGKRISLQLNASAAKEPVRLLECKVAQEQPLLRIRRTSLTHGAVMLYNGETLVYSRVYFYSGSDFIDRSAIRITLENISALPIDFLRLSFEDSTIAVARHALADGQLSVFDTYETEYDLINRPMFSWDSPDEFKRVNSGQKVTLTVNCFGKIGWFVGFISLG